LEDGGNGVQALAASLEVSGAGIILWDDFWKAASRLLTGASLESVLQREGPANRPQQNDIINEVSEIVVDSTNSVPLALTQFGEADSPLQQQQPQQQSNVARGASPPSSGMESDEELAKRLAAEWGTGNVQEWETEHVSGQQMTDTTAGKSDEELARELQAQWNATETEGNDGINSDVSSTTAVNDLTYEMNQNNDYDMELSTINEIDNTAKKSSDGILESHKPNEIQSHNFEQFGESFQLHHYNGLRGGLLTSFQVTRLSSQEAVGASVALSNNAQGAGAAVSAGKSGSGGGDLEDVVRTKYPSCTFDWGGRSPPFID